ncbi:MAG TPA: cob(I)yrinic acid a,c-diamide adenosyltransferase [Acidobacteriota bacterium]|nr:cob(I)yrinic acid a,c-diamide adenosyltransferase [Acidobacteriota bacterium]
MGRIYTRTGDDGNTVLTGGERVSKNSPAIEAVGAVYELNALIGIVRCHSLPVDIDRLLQLIQEQLFVAGADLAAADGKGRGNGGIGDAAIIRLENEIDAIENSLSPLRKFIFPGGSPAGAHLHYACAVARRAERRCVAMAAGAGVAPEILRYMNRLSDLLFVLARSVNQRDSIPERNST